MRLASSLQPPRRAAARRYAHLVGTAAVVVCIVLVVVGIALVVVGIVLVVVGTVAAEVGDVVIVTGTVCWRLARCR